MTTNEASQILREMVLATLDDDQLAEMGEQWATYELRREALNALEAERDRWRKAYEVLYANVCGDCGYAKEGMQLAEQALGGGDE